MPQFAPEVMISSGCQQMASGLRLLCTIVGGAEEAALESILNEIPSAVLEWRAKGASGSQLVLTLATPPDTVALSLVRLRAIEYLYVLLSHEHIPDPSLERIGAAVERIRPVMWDVAVNLCRQVDATHIFPPGPFAPNLATLKVPGLVLAPGGDEVPATPAGHGIGHNVVFTLPHIAQGIVEKYLQQIQAAEGPTTRLLYVDAGAGGGALLQHLPDPSVGLDTYPASPQVICADYLSLTPHTLSALFSEGTDAQADGVLCVISNPPFSVRRGDYSDAASFLNHSVALGAKWVGAVLPASMWKERVLHALDIHPRLHVTSWFRLPTPAFHSPDTGKFVRVDAIFSLWAVGEEVRAKWNLCPARLAPNRRLQVHVEAKRGGTHPFSSLDLKMECARALTKLASSSTSPIDAARDGPDVERELMVHLHHSDLSIGLQLTAMPLSYLTPSAHHVLTAPLHLHPSISHVAVRCLRGVGGLTVDPLCGGMSLLLDVLHESSITFVIGGDTCPTRLACVADSLTTRQRTRVDLVLWDVMALPLRAGAVDCVIADLPFGSALATPNGYPSLFAQESLRSVLRPHGRGVFTSPDRQNLQAHVNHVQEWKVDSAFKVMMHGLPGIVLSFRMKPPPTVHMSLWDAAHISSEQLLSIAQNDPSTANNLVTHVRLIDEYQTSEKRESRTFEIEFDRASTSESQNSLLEWLRSHLQGLFGVEIR